MYYNLLKKISIFHFIFGFITAYTMSKLINSPYTFFVFPIICSLILCIYEYFKLHKLPFSNLIPLDKVIQFDLINDEIEKKNREKGFVDGLIMGRVIGLFFITYIYTIVITLFFRIFIFL
jgi:hypothetical protein